MEKQKVLITDEMHPLFLEGLEKLNISSDYEPEITQEEVLQKIHLYDGLVISTKIQISKELVDKAVRLKFVARAGSGMDNLDVQYAATKGINCLNSPEGNSNAVAEHAVGMLLSLLHNISKSDREVRKGLWLREANRGFELQKRTVGVIGYGNTGSAFAVKLKGFCQNVLVYDKYKSSFGDDFVQEASLNQIFSKADIISLHIPLTEETHKMVNLHFIKKFSKPVFLINTARGKIVDLNELTKALEENLVLGAALDVLENENIQSLSDTEKRAFDYLANSDKVILTPHIAGWTFESKIKIAEVLLQKIKNTQETQ